MSSLTTAGSSSTSGGYTVSVSMSAEEFAGTHLSLSIGGGGGGGAASRSRINLPPAPPRMTVVQLFGEVLSVVQEDDRRDGHGGGYEEAQAAVSTRSHHNRLGRPTASRKKKRDGCGATASADHSDDRQRKKKAKTTTRQRASDGGGGRKKLRLTAAQATMLEDSFRAHNILSHGEKQELARRVGLSARQVEVWFQNRRARTKLKQTELDCDLLRRWCDRLTDENARLRRDLDELRRGVAAPSTTTRLAAVCASCGDKQKKLAVVAAGNMLV